MSSNELERRLAEKGIKIKVLWCEDVIGEWWIVYTFDLNYTPLLPNNRRDFLYEEEKDIIAKDYDDAVEYVQEAATECNG